jgi:hypothetical protein
MAMQIVGMLVVSMALIAASACGKSGPDKAKLAGLCTEATSQLANASGGDVDGDTFTLMLQNALTACSGACDAKDDASCTQLGSHLGTICGVSADVCTSLCGSAESPSLKKHSCDHAGKTP